MRNPTAHDHAQRGGCNYQQGISTARSRPRQPCGTPAAARRHHKRGEALDDACREAFRRYHREYRRAARHVDAFRRREIQARTRWQQRLNADPERRERRQQQQRQAAKDRQQRDADDLRNYVDPVAIDRFLAGDTTIRLTRAERRAAFHRLRHQGHSLTAAATQLHLSGSTARRYEALRCSFSVLVAADNAGHDDLEEMAG